MASNLTAEEKQARLTEIAKSVSDEVIRLSDKRQLEVWCKGLFPISKLRKAELAEKLVELVAPTRKHFDELVKAEQMRLETERMAADLAKKEEDLEIKKYAIYLTEQQKPDVIERRKMQRLELGEDVDTSVDGEAKLVFDELVRVANTVGNDYTQRLNRVAAIFANHNQRETSIFAPLTRRSRVTEIKELMNKLVSEYPDEAMQPILNSLKDSFIGLMSAGMSTIHKAYRQQYEKQVSEKHRTAQENIDGGQLLDFAIKALIECTDWRDVSIALIITTGRRMSEIHGVTTRFQIVGDNVLLFEGQMKTKGRTDVNAFEIPTLVPASLVMTGINYLKDCERLYDETADLDLHEVVNKKVSMALSRQVKKHFNGRIYYDFRAIYAEMCWIKWGVNNPMTKTGYFSTILGHDDRSVSTALSYQKFRVNWDV